jgi:hypothetical protein
VGAGEGATVSEQAGQRSTLGAALCCRRQHSFAAPSPSRSPNDPCLTPSSPAQQRQPRLTRTRGDPRIAPLASPATLRAASLNGLGTGPALMVAAPSLVPSGSLSSLPGLALSAAHMASSRKKSKAEVCEAFLARLQLTAPDLSADVELMLQLRAHFERLPTRYALDVNVEGLDPLSHKRLLDEARADPTTVSFAVRPVEIVAHHPPAIASPQEVRPVVRFVLCHVSICMGLQDLTDSPPLGLRSRPVAPSPTSGWVLSVALHLALRRTSRYAEAGFQLPGTSRHNRETYSRTPAGCSRRLAS